MNKIVSVEYPRPRKPSPPKRPHVLQTYPTPWRLGWCHESKCEVIAANGSKFDINASMMGFCGAGARDIAEMFVAVANATGVNNDE